MKLKKILTSIRKVGSDNCRGYLNLKMVQIEWIKIYRTFTLSKGLVIILLLISNCIYLQGKRLELINYPKTAFDSGFVPGKADLNNIYFREWCSEYCETIQAVSESLPENYYIEIHGKVDATETPKDRERLSLGRATSVKKLLSAYGISASRLKAIADPEPDQYLGRDKFDPENRKVRFRIQKKE